MTSQMVSAPYHANEMLFYSTLSWSDLMLQLLSKDAQPISSTPDKEGLVGNSLNGPFRLSKKRDHF